MKARSMLIHAYGPISCRITDTEPNFYTNRVRAPPHFRFRRIKREQRVSFGDRKGLRGRPGAMTLHSRKRERRKSRRRVLTRERRWSRGRRTAAKNRERH